MRQRMSPQESPPTAGFRHHSDSLWWTWRRWMSRRFWVGFGGSVTNMDGHPACADSLRPCPAEAVLGPPHQHMTRLRVRGSPSSFWRTSVLLLLSLLLGWSPPPPVPCPGVLCHCGVRQSVQMDAAGPEQLLQIPQAATRGSSGACSHCLQGLPW